jgi:thioredoxin reductase (NADPH)
MKTLVVEKSDVGGQIKITAEVANYPGVVSISGAGLAAEMKKQALSFGATFITGDISQVDFSQDIKSVQTQLGDTYSALGVIIATGAKPRKLGFEGEQEFIGRGIAYCATCDGEFFSGKEVFVIGAGFAAAEEAIFLTRYASKVTVIAREPEFTCSKTIADKVLAHERIEVKFNTELLYVRGDRVIKEAKFVNNQTKETWLHKVDKGTFGVFIFVGYEPESEVFKGHVLMNENGYIPADQEMQTDIPGVYAAGDIRPKRLRQLVSATSDGAVAATAAEKYIADIKSKLGIVIAAEPEQKADEYAGDEVFDEDVSTQIKYVMERCVEDIIICAILQPNSPLSDNIRGFLKGFSEVTDRMPIQIYERGESPEIEAKITTDLYPIIALFDKNESYTGIGFHGVPGGHELESFILAIYNAAGPGQSIPEPLEERIRKLKPCRLKIGVSLSCTMCPELVQNCQRMAALNKGVSAEMIDLQFFSELREEFDIMSVPALVVNDNDVLFGKKSIEELVTYLE